ncbi:LSU ribosomal protein L21P [Clostridium cavendishii DSM 21758]|uniref:Large ribosomal subunit protein bL21 n=1 Tax=Clostridium cavendishii DSM 21758 TaxID=1121302 RepID=A0A1M6BI95_9CLOT|nr:50S ribosomal protein L21 [Clostridium cavendishii]SHI48500.1 LSU ribosomal protein L21P [Clostridium cavendishii DSM 21758]
MYAVLTTGGKQYRVQEGDVLFVEKLNAEVDATVELTEVLAVSKDGELKVGKPVVEGAKVVAKVLSQGKAKKVVVFKYKPKKDYRKKTGHRQSYTKIVIEKIEA